MAPRFMVNRKMADSEYKSNFVPEVSLKTIVYQRKTLAYT